MAVVTAAIVTGVAAVPVAEEPLQETFIAALVSRLARLLTNRLLNLHQPEVLHRDFFAHAFFHPLAHLGRHAFGDFRGNLHGRLISHHLADLVRHLLGDGDLFIMAGRVWHFLRAHFLDRTADGVRHLLDAGFLDLAPSVS